MQNNQEKLEVKKREKKEQLINPMTGKPVDEIITEKEAKKRGYFDYQFLLKYLEDDNEFVKFFMYDGKEIIVDLEKPYLQYKKPTQINHERVLNDAKPEKQINNSTNIYKSDTCNVDDEGCVNCSG